MDDPDLKLLLGVIILIVFGVVGWTYRDQLFGAAEPGPVSVAEPAPPVAPEEPGGPQHPVPEPPVDAATGELMELPPLDDSDAYFLIEIGLAFGPTIESLLLRDGVIDRLVTTVDNLTRRELPEKIRPVGRIQVAFSADQGSDDTMVLGQSSYARYDGLIAQLYYADTNKAFDTYQRFYPLFQQAYERLGYPDAYFNDRLVEVIDHLIATPLPEGPIMLVRPNVLYEFADPDLEALSSGQKLLLRIGPNNAGTLKRVLEKFRGRLIAGN
jgi:hypothetical protein